SHGLRDLERQVAEPSGAVDRDPIAGTSPGMPVPAHHRESGAEHRRRFEPVHAVRNAYATGRLGDHVLREPAAIPLPGNRVRAVDLAGPRAMDADAASALNPSHADPVSNRKAGHSRPQRFYDADRLVSEHGRK